jgi:hypothetical protein
MFFTPGKLYKLKKSTVFDVVEAFKFKEVPGESILTHIKEEIDKSYQYRGVYINSQIFIYNGMKLRFLPEFLDSRDEILEDCFELVIEDE